MVASVCSKDRRNWIRLVEDVLPAGESQELTAHLAGCPSCRAKFESLCADEAWWKDSSDTLRAIGRESGVFHTSDQSSLTFSNVIGRESKPKAEAKKSPLVVISGLKPSSEPGILGELGEYLIQEVIGYGGMGTVLKAWDKRLARVVAIKVLHPHLATSAVARVRFAREAQLVASISHPNVVPIHDVADDHTQPYIVMGYVSGGSLQERLDREGPLSLEESLRIALQIAEGLEAAHSHGLVHRDIKPANILLEARWQRVLITDFGLARALDDSSITASGHLAGTPQYMSPEQSKGEKVDHRSDLFSLGSVLYTMLSGRPPFRAESAVAIIQKVGREQARPVHEIQDHLPFWAHQLIERLHAKNPNERISSTEDASRLIRVCLQHVQNPSNGLLPRGFHVTKQGYVRPAINLVAILLTGGLLALAVMNWTRMTDSAATSSIQESTVRRSNSAQFSPASDVHEGVQKPAANQNQAEVGTRLSFAEETVWSDSIDQQLDFLSEEVSQAGLENR